MRRMFGFLIGIMVGALVGSTVALLLAPETGEELRKETNPKMPRAARSRAIRPCAPAKREPIRSGMSAIGLRAICWSMVRTSWSGRSGSRLRTARCTADASCRGSPVVRTANVALPR